MVFQRFVSITIHQLCACAWRRQLHPHQRACMGPLPSRRAVPGIGPPPRAPGMAPSARIHPRSVDLHWFQRDQVLPAAILKPQQRPCFFRRVLLLLEIPGAELRSLCEMGFLPPMRHPHGRNFGRFSSSSRSVRFGLPRSLWTPRTQPHPKASPGPRGRDR